MTAKQFIIHLIVLAIASPAVSSDTIPVTECVNLIQEAGARCEGRGNTFERYGDLLLLKDDKVAALRAYQQALLDGGTDGVSTSEKLALLQEQLGRLDEAIVSWKHLLELKPDHPAAIDRLARLYIQRTGYRQALPLLKKLHEQNPEDACYAAMLGRAYQNERKLDESEAAFTAARQADSEDREIVLNLGALYRYRGKQEEAARLYKDYLIYDDSDREIRRLFVVQQIRLKRVDTDTVAMLELEARDEPSAGNLYRLAMAYKLKGVADLSQITLERALDADPAHDKTLTALGRHYFLKGDYIKAKDYFTRVSQESNESDDADEYLRKIRLLTTPVVKKAVKKNSAATKTKKKSGQLSVKKSSGKPVKQTKPVKTGENR